MLTRILKEAAEKNRLIIIDGAICRFRFDKRGFIVLNDIVSIKPGAGSQILEMLIDKEPDYILAKCPKEWEANNWYLKKGFILTSEEDNMNVYVLTLKEGLI